ncbi:hypothetical protein PFISCL1PPCAC_3651, partial [Pristionchus fissidentatus]
VLPVVAVKLLSKRCSKLIIEDYVIINEMEMETMMKGLCNLNKKILLAMRVEGRDQKSEKEGHLIVEVQNYWKMQNQVADQGWLVIEHEDM